VSGGLRFGVTLAAYPDGVPPAAWWWRFAERAEALGFDSLWAGEHVLFHTETVSATVLLAGLAARTGRIRLGTAIYLLPLRHPVLAAKDLATLDHITGGRLVVGLGVGWSLDEFEAAGAPRARRGARADEFVRCLKAMWADDPVEFAGEFYRVPRSLVSPKPVQRPHPPILIGGYAEAVFRRAVTLGDGYTGGNIPLDELAPLVARLRALAREARRDPAALPIVCRRAAPGRHKTAGPR